MCCDRLKFAKMKYVLVSGGEKTAFNCIEDAVHSDTGVISGIGKGVIGMLKPTYTNREFSLTRPQPLLRGCCLRQLA